MWRLEADGLTKVQLTREEAGVQEFSVSPADASLAFVSNNQLFLEDGHGENRRLIADAVYANDNQRMLAQWYGGSGAFSSAGTSMSVFAGTSAIVIVRSHMPGSVAMRTCSPS